MRFLFSIDTEGDNLWSQPRAITTRNAAYLPRFQALCEAYGFEPTYLTNYEMAKSPAFCEFARDVLARGAGEVGMHLHAWNSPPLEPLTDNDLAHQPYLIEYPERVLREKVRAMTGLLEETFGRKMVTHRAGRWAMNTTYARVLVEEGYLVDSSVTPYVSWRGSKGDPSGCGGTDYSAFPENPYFIDLNRLDKPGASPLLEVPMTTAPRWDRVVARLPRALQKLRPLEHWARSAPPLWLRPRGKNLADMRFLIERALHDGKEHVQMMLHSSELMPGGSPTFANARAIDALYGDLTELFERYKGRLRGSTFAELRAAHTPTPGPA